MPLSNRLLVPISAILCLGYFSAFAQTVTITVDAKAGPWSPSLNPSLAYGIGDQLPQPQQPKVAVRSGALVKIKALPGGGTTADGGGQLAGPGGYTEGQGWDDWTPTNGNAGSSGANHPSFYTPADWDTNLMSIMGAFTNDAGVVIGPPFEIGNEEVEKRAPSGATYVQIGINDDIFGDNTGSHQVEVTDIGGRTYALCVGVNWGFGDLQGIDSARLVAKGIQAFLGSQNVEVLELYSNQTGNIFRIRDKLHSLFQPSSRKIQPGDTLIFYIHTHGTQGVIGPNTTVSKNDERLVEVQYEPENENARVLNGADEYLEMGGGEYLCDDFFQILFRGPFLPEMEQVNKLFLINACFSGGMIGNAESIAMGDSGDLSVLPKTAVIASSKEGDYTWGLKFQESFFGAAIYESLLSLRSIGPELFYHPLRLAIDENYRRQELDHAGELARICSTPNLWNIDVPIRPGMCVLESFIRPDFVWMASATPLAPFAITSPSTNSVQIPENVGIILKANGDADFLDLPTFTWSQVSGPGNVIFDDSNTLTTGARFDAPGTYVLRITAVADAQTVMDEVTVEYAPRGRKDLVLGVHQQAPSYNIAGNHPAFGDVHLLLAAGTGLNPNSMVDGAFLVGKTVTGDFDIYCYTGVLSNPGGSVDCRFGLMARAAPGTATGGKYAAALFRVDDTPEFSRRATENAAASIENLPALTEPTQPGLRLVRNGNIFTAYAAADGVTWQQIGESQNIDLGASPIVGLVATSAVPDSLAGIVFAVPDFVLPPVSSSTSPFVSAGPDLVGGQFQMLEGSVAVGADPSPPGVALEWQHRDESSASVVFNEPTSAGTLVNIDTPGVYSLRLTANNGTVTTFDDVIVTRNDSPIEDWLTNVFGDSATDPQIAGDLADHDMDNLPTLLEYALGLDPNTPDGMNLVIEHKGGVTEVTYERRKVATDVNIVLETSSDLVNWSVPTTLDWVVEEDEETRTVKSVFQSTGHREFVRLKVTR